MNPQRPSVNYLYFGLFFFVLCIITASAIYNREFIGGSQFFFFFYGLGQAVLEVTLLSFFAGLILKYLGKVPFFLFIGLSFVGLIFHIFDFLMDRILDLSIWETFKIFVLDESFENFIYLLDASGIALPIWFAFFTLVAALPLLGVAIYKSFEKLIEARPMFLRKSFFFQSFLCIPIALFYWDYSASTIIHPDTYSAFIKSLPWKCTFLQPETTYLSLKNPLPRPMQEQKVMELVQNDSSTLKKKPNIYLFIVESLREDAITPQIAPNLTAFKNAYQHTDLSFSNGNGTHISWFSIFHSQFPFHWKNQQQNWTTGSPALALFKKWGYQIRLYTSAQLGYYKMGPFLFGKDLLSDAQEFHHQPPLLAADSDQMLLSKLQKDLKDPQLHEGQLFIIFWDGTHFEYSWPEDFAPKFSPYAVGPSYLKTFQSKEMIELIRNRYRNGVNHMDFLFGKFMQEVPRKDEAMIVFAGDHGEEFFEHGHLFHNSHLSKEQTHVPLYFKVGRTFEEKKIASHMDIFPTLCDCLTGSVPSFLEGASLLRKKEWPFAVTARFNAGSTPYEFAIHNHEYKLIARFNPRHQIHEANQLQIVSLRTWDDKLVSETKNSVKPWIQEEFGAALKRIFSALPEELSVNRQSDQTLPSDPLASP
jgi:hypothetical protein